MGAEIKPYRISIGDNVLDDLKFRLRNTRWPEAELVDDWSQGAPLQWIREVCRYWAEEYDWRQREARLNRFAQFTTEIDGLDIHFLHVRSPHPGAMPLIITHGWPGSVVEFQRAMPLLAAQGFDLVIPSLPGYAWSGRPQGPIGAGDVARIWRTLMTDVLGYRRFGAQGGDWGSAVTFRLGREHQDVVAAIHLNLFQALRPQGPDEVDESDYWRRVGELTMRESAYMLEHMTKPQTIGLALHDNPVGWAAWVIEKFHGWSDRRKPFEQSFSKDQLITNLMTYLVNDAVISSIWLYRGIVGEVPNAGRVEVPTGLALYPGEFYPYPSRAAAERAFNLQRWTEMTKGGHFAAMEEPQDFAADVGSFFQDYA
jgi:microsomal epoxide hydrolase